MSLTVDIPEDKFKPDIGNEVFEQTPELKIIEDEWTNHL